MSRFYDRLMRLGCQPATQEGLVIGAHVASDIKRATVVDITEVGRYFYAESDQEYWHVARDFPTVISPWDLAFFEYHHAGLVNSEVYGTHREPPATFGWAIKVTEITDEIRARMTRDYETFQPTAPGVQRDLPEDWLRDTPTGPANLEDCRWSMQGVMFLEMEKGKPATGPYGVIEVPVLSDGTVATWGGDGEHAAFKTQQLLMPQNEAVRDPDALYSIANGLQTGFYPVFLALSLLHCKNVKAVDHEPPEAPSRKHAKKYGAPLAPYKTIEIEPFKSAAKKIESKGEQSGGARALKIYRGHFKTFSEEKPLFGKHSGTYWWTPRVNEKAKRDYKVRR